MTQEALKLALEALCPIAYNTTDDPRGQAYKAITAIKEALAQEQEQDGECKYCTDGCPACDARKLPAQRTWVGLTDKDISEIVRGTHNTGSFVRAIEAKLKEKNNA